LELDIEDHLPDLISDPDRIEQVLVILLDNAMRYAGEGGTIRIITRQDTSDVHVSVWDSGCGIAPEDMVHVFERFYKTDKSRKEGGTGLGLSIAKQIMDKLDEQITVESEVGKWTCFTFTVKKYVSNAIALGPVDDAAIVYSDLTDDQSQQMEAEKDAVDAPFEVLKQDKKADKSRFKGRAIKKKESK
jgi:anti-sigma regulatory factor (Ser/Thr protein kinase)